MKLSSPCLSFIGTAGIPNRYGGFESFVEHCAAHLARDCRVLVTCDPRLYEDRSKEFRGIERVFVNVPANTAWSILHDLLAFAAVFRRSSAIVVLGVSGGIWFPFFRLCCALAGKHLVVNIDGVEWRRTKYSTARRAFLRLSDALAQAFAGRIVYDNPALERFVSGFCRGKATLIPYSGDHVRRLPDVSVHPKSALTVCRIEPENNIELMIEGALQSGLSEYVIAGNWNGSEFGRRLRAKHGGNPRLELRDPVYDAVELARLRESCAVYLHGHSVGGTNPSLVEMMFYDCDILCFDCDFNRHTARGRAHYFKGTADLAAKIDAALATPGSFEKIDLRSYTGDRIAQLYLELCGTPRSSRARAFQDGA